MFPTVLIQISTAIINLYIIRVYRNVVEMFDIKIDRFFLSFCYIKTMNKYDVMKR